MDAAISETTRRRNIQIEYNAEHGITPTTIVKPVTDILASLRGAKGAPVPGADQRRGRPGQSAVREEFRDVAPSDLGRLIGTLELEMNEASAELRFEYAARLRDEIKELRREMREAGLA
jgi:excinuclease ABC subunit B